MGNNPKSIGKWVIYGFLVIILGIWLVNTPAGLLGKADAIGCAICHRIDERSFHLASRQLPLCARCSGMYLGALTSLIYQLRLGKRGGMPPTKIMIVLGMFFLAFAIDGVNSYFHFFSNLPTLYQSTNWLRLLTGSGVGLSIAAVLFPTFHQTVWEKWDSQPAIGTFGELGILVILVLFVDGLILSENPLLLYPLALMSAAGVIILLTIAYSLIWILLFKKDNQFNKPAQLILPLAGGLIITMLQIGLFDLGRFWLTGTWEGFHIILQ
jgi:uncharacterized membrane protein